MISKDNIEETRVKLKYPSTEIHAVFFTDGGCRPNPGIGGWGLHGYIYTLDDPKKGHGCKGFQPTNKGYINLPTEEAYAKVSVLKYIDGSGSMIPEATNNRAELQAFNKALEISLHAGCKDVHCVLDSEYVLRGIKKIPEWIAANWKNSDRSDVANNDLWRATEELIRQLTMAQANLTFSWTKGHSDSVGNNIADSNATRGIIAGRKGVHTVDVDVSDIKDYWSPDVDRHPFLQEPNFYFKMHDGTHHFTEDGRTIYFTGDHGNKDEWLGKPDPETCFSVSFLTKPDPVLETVRQLQNKEYQSVFSSIVIAKMNNLFNPKVWKNLSTYLGTYVQRVGQKIDLYTHDNVQITKEMRPAQQSFVAESELIQLETILTNVVNGQSPEFYPLTDITDLIYEMDSSKKKPVRKVRLSMEDHIVDVVVSYNTTGEHKTCPVKLTIGTDIPRRNTFSALAETETRVYVVTWKHSSNAFRYATIIKTEQDIGIWAGVYSNLRLLTSS